MASGYPDYEGGKSKLYSAAGWSAIAATDKNFHVVAVNQAWGFAATTGYAVPAGKTLYIVGVSYGSIPAAADYDHQIWVEVQVWESALSLVVHEVAAGGGWMNLDKPVVVKSGDLFEIDVVNRSNLIVAYLVGAAWGFEV